MTRNHRNSKNMKLFKIYSLFLLLSLHLLAQEDPEVDANQNFHAPAAEFREDFDMNEPTVLSETQRRLYQGALLVAGLAVSTSEVAAPQPIAITTLALFAGVAGYTLRHDERNIRDDSFISYISKNITPLTITSTIMGGFVLLNRSDSYLSLGAPYENSIIKGLSLIMALGLQLSLTGLGLFVLEDM